MFIVFKSIVFNISDIGKQSFIANIDDIRNELEMNYWGDTLEIPYIYLKDIKILIDSVWFDVNSSGQIIKSKIGKRLEKLNLESGDLISFNAIVEKSDIYFDNIEGEEQIDKDYSFSDSDFSYLPRSYDGEIVAEVYETSFNILNERLGKNNYKEFFLRKKLNKMKKELNFKRKATAKLDGYFSEIQSMYFYGKRIKNISGIEKY